MTMNNDRGDWQKMVAVVFFSASVIGLPVLGSSIVASAASLNPIPVAMFSGALPSWAGSGSTLSVYQWPNLSGAVVGQPMNLVQVASVPVSGAQYSVALPSGIDNNYQFVVKDGTNTGTVTVSGAPTSVGGPSTAAAGTSAATINVPPLYIPPSTTSVTSDATPTPMLTVYPPNCYATLNSTVGTEDVQVGEAHTLSTTHGSFSYGGSTTSTVGIGISSSGAWGSFRSEGNYGQTTGWTTSLTIPSSTHEKVAAQFYDGKFALYCNVSGYPGDLYMGIAEIPYQYTGTLVGDGTAGTNPSGSCPHPPSIVLTTTNSQTASYGSSRSYGAQVSLLGFSFGETTSFDSSTSMQWWANAGTGSTGLCGPGQTYPVGQPVVYNSAL